MEVLLEGGAFFESPRWHEDRWWFSDFFRGVVVAGGEEIVHVPGMPSGLGWLPDGTLLVVSMRDRRVLRLRDGDLELHADLSQLCDGYANDMVVAPDGSAGQVQNFNVGRYRATFDVQVNKPGTWKLALVNAGAMGTYLLNGKEERLPRGTRLDQLPGAVPAGATDVKLSENVSRNEVFVTSGAPTQTVLKPTGQGLEFAPVTHPNDLAAGEEATFGFLIDGNPAVGLKVNILPGGSRYRTSLGEQVLTTDARGQIKVKWPVPGMYWLNATAEGKSGAIPGGTKRMGYTATLEVLGG
jgi:hypothetical protein